MFFGGQQGTYIWFLSFMNQNERLVRKPDTGLRSFRPGPTQTRLYNHTRWLEASNFVLTKKRGCTIRVAKTKALISFAVTAKLICVFVFPYAKSRFSHDAAQIHISEYVQPDLIFTCHSSQDFQALKAPSLK